ncbi:hypothetical protein SDC9_197434 [bioreactor metagenome]|uniref:Uncharacterized protein n=1 Tax=bioreactor metagenome TaxID=1076179 RepID=A0A645IG46_9ZZZZ
MGSSSRLNRKRVTAFRLPVASTRHCTIRKLSSARFHCGLIDVTLIRLSCAQVSTPFSSFCSACDKSTGSVLVCMPSHRVRSVASREMRARPSVTFFLRSAIRAERAFHEACNGVISSLSAANRPSAASARISSNCCRFLMFNPHLLRSIESQM